MLGQYNVSAVIPAKDLQRALAYYKEKLGLEPVRASEGYATYRGGDGTSFEMYETPFAGTAKNTVMCWLVDDLEGKMASLRAKGVVFEEYDMPGLKTKNGIVESEEGKAAWFIDSEGNILCITETSEQS